MKKTRRPSPQARARQAIERAERDITAAGWTVRPVDVRFVATKRFTEPEDDSTTTLYESDYTVEGLAALVARREREEGRK